MLITISIFSMISIFFICRILQFDIDDNKVIFISIFTILIGIGLALLVINGDDNFSFYTRYISFLFIFYGFSSGIQYISKKNK